MAQMLVGNTPSEQVVFPSFSFSKDWQVIGPFQIGTREAAWGADPLARLGGFHNLVYDASATFKSSLALGGNTSWSHHTAEVSSPSVYHAEASLNVEFPLTDWTFLQHVYGWAGLQWQGWARGEILIHADEDQNVLFHVHQIIEFWIDDVHYFGGDFYENGHAPLTIRLGPGTHKVEVRLVRDVRAFGGIGQPTLDVKLQLTRLYPGAQPLVAEEVLVSDVMGGKNGKLISSYASVSVRNDGEEDAFIHNIDGMRDVCRVELLSETPIKVVPGQTRPVGFRIECVPPFNRRFDLQLRFRTPQSHEDRPIYFGVAPRVIDGMREPAKTTFLHPGGMISYAILRPPPADHQTPCSKKTFVPIVVVLHGAGVEADSDMARHSMDQLSDLCAWTLFPSGVTPWSGDDWHTWGLRDIEAAIDAVPAWADRMDWNGPSPDVYRWIVVGHSNGGQGTWYAITHRPDRIIAAAALSGYSSIQSYIPYSFWRTADPGRESIIQSALLSYRHELLLENIQDIPLYQQHGSADDNVPAYHSRLLSHRIDQVGGETTYVELENKPHWWDGIMSTEGLSAFLREQLDLNIGHGPKIWNNPRRLSDFSLVVANPGDTGWKHLAKIMQLIVPGRLGRLDFEFDNFTATCMCRSSNVAQFMLKPPFAQECGFFYIDEQQLDISKFGSEEICINNSKLDGWSIQDSTKRSVPFMRQRQPSQQGGLEAILRSKGAFQIFAHSPAAQRLALQVSRNMHQYYAADTVVASSYTEALDATGAIISLAIGADLPPTPYNAFPLTTSENGVLLRDDSQGHQRYVPTAKDGLAAIFIRPPQRLNDRVELVVWGVDEASLAVAARLVPMMTGTGQPDFVVTDRSMLWKAVDAVRAMGFFDEYWQVSRNAFISDSFR